MLGMLFEMLNAEATGIAPVAASETPSANAIAHCRTNPRAREMIVPADMIAVERASEGCSPAIGGLLEAMASGSGSASRGSVDDSSPAARARGSAHARVSVA